MGGCTDPMFLLVDNSDSPSVVEQSQQERGSGCYTLLPVIPSSMKCLMPYACQLASCSMCISYYASTSCSTSLHSPCPSLPLLLVCLPLCPLVPGALQPPFYPGCFLIEPWHSLSEYLHPAIACLASWTSDWAGAFWGSLSGFVISYLLLGVHPSVTLVKLIMIGCCLG